MVDRKIDYSVLWETNNGGGKPPPPVTPPASPRLQALSDENCAKLEEAARFRAKWTENIMLSDSLRCEINHGLKHGEDLRTVLLKAIKAISLMTNDTAMLSAALRDLENNYGYVDK